MDQEQNIGIGHPETNLRSSTLPWLGGALEAGGTITFQINQNKKTGRVESLPFIIFRETRETFIDSLNQELGGHKRKVGNSWEWRLNGYRAAEIVATLDPYVVSRREMVTAIQNWLHSDTSERVTIAQEMRGHNRYEQGSIEDYEELLKNSIFVAGILDNRGNIYPSYENGNPRITVSSKNHHLLRALQKLYGGVVQTTAKEGTRMTVSGRVGETKVDSHTWTTVNVNARELIESTLPYLRIQPYEGWNRRIRQEMAQARTEETDIILTFIKDELERFQKGETNRLSTNSEIAERFKVSRRRIKKRVSNLEGNLKSVRQHLLLSQAAKERNEIYGNPSQKK